MASEIDSLPTDSPDLAGSVFGGGGEMGALMRAFDWSRTAVGPVDRWPQSLRTSVSTCLNSRFAIVFWWGPEMVTFYNDAYAPILGTHHPTALGRPARQVWPEIWEIVGPMLNGVLERGEATYSDDLLLLLHRNGYQEECYFTFSYSPIRDESGGVSGIFTPVFETTGRVIGERRLRTSRDLADARAASSFSSVQEACQTAIRVLAQNSQDLPFAAIYLFDKSETSATLVASTGEEPRASRGAEPGATLLPNRLSQTRTDSSWIPLARLARGESCDIDLQSFALDGLPTAPWGIPPVEAIAVPMRQKGKDFPTGFLLAGVNPRKRVSEEFRSFCRIVADQIGNTIREVEAFEQERRRAEELAALDHAKTLFFSNVSHEFRTPLTLMLGPLEEVLPEARERLSPTALEQLTHARRNALRLLKLVNTLLDFSRIEAGRVSAVFEPVDLCSLTSEMANAFRFAIEKAGLRYTVACAPLDELVYIDREMWEKIVLNLLSNAFKFTFDGEIDLTLKQSGRSIELTVRDTGVGIAKDDCQRIFERFHRIENTRSRTYEGTGIGLSLVQELARLHSGTVGVESAPGQGSTFTVTIPLGTAHLPVDRLRTGGSVVSTALGAEAYIEEAQRWLPQESGSGTDEFLLLNLPAAVSASEETGSANRKCIVIADDNSDMRGYLTHLLRDEYDVHAVADGIEAVEATRRLRPALVLTDVMMPSLDGFGVLSAIRSEPALSGTPVILLSARAGEESRVEGLHAGADDYMVKPFTARELKARIATHVKLAKLRRQTERERRLYDTILSNTPDLAYVFDLDHRFIYANKALLSMWGRTWKESIGKNCLEIGYEPWHAAMHDVEIEQVIATKEPIRGEVPFTGTNGRRVYDYIFVPVLGPEGDVEAIAGTTRDVTERVNAEDALRRSEERLRAFVRATSDVVYRMSPDWSEMRQLAGKDFVADTAEADRDWLSKYIHPDDQPRLTKTIAEAIRSRGIFELEHRVLRLDGTLGWTASRAVPLLSPDGEILEWFGTAADVTERKKSEEALRRTEKLAAAGRLAATVAHEINNPLAAVTNLLYLARNSSDPAMIQSWLATADEELSRISHLTNQTLGFYRQTEGVRSIRVGATLTSLLAVFTFAARNRKIVIEPEIKDDPEIMAAGGEIRQLIANLISNAIDAVENGGRIRIRISATTVWRDGFRREGSRGVRLTVADNGGGISPAIRAQIFDPFFTSKQDVGTGLGLWVSKNIVEKHRGTIRVKSSPVPAQSWTVFSVCLPALGYVPGPVAVDPDFTGHPRTAGGNPSSK
ncbi:MAG: ATP-binding protein [Terracidiphilus sp.]